MPIVTRHSLLGISVVALATLAAVGAFVWSGIYNIGADDSHTRPVYTLLQTLRDRSITARAHKLHPPPNLDDPALILRGAGNYDAMCSGCHLAPGMEATELSRGLYPSPPNLSKADVADPSHHFWVVKHGIKASGMPAWGKSMADEHLWGMVAFLQQLPKLDAGQYRAMVASSGGHSHGGGETRPPADHHDTTAPAAPASKPAAGTIEHRHADGTLESHPAPQPTPADGHDHQH